MKPLLMHPHRDFDPKPAVPVHWYQVMQDLALYTVVRAAAGEDTFLAGMLEAAWVSSLAGDAATVRHRQDVLRDCLSYPAAIREVYALTLEALEIRRKSYFGFSRYPSGILSGSVDLLRSLTGVVRKLRGVADRHAGQFVSQGLATLCATLQRELSDDYLATVEAHLATLRFQWGVLISAQVGGGNEGTGYVLRQPPAARPGWVRRLLGRRAARSALTVRIHERDDAGARALGELRDQGLNEAANAAARAAEHLESFFQALRVELAFYVCCLNLRERLETIGVPLALPHPETPGTRVLRYRGLYDIPLALTMGRGIVGNGGEARGKSLVVITGANQGGKSTFLRSVGVAQLMMQAGMFVGAESFAAELCTNLFTHFKREEDAGLTMGKLDEELRRLSDMVDAITPNAMLLCNESFAATNEREGSEIARQVVEALLEKQVKVLFVTHLYAFAHGIVATRTDDALALRAERTSEGTRTFRVIPGEPLETSYAEDLYREVFAEEEGDPSGG